MHDLDKHGRYKGLLGLLPHLSVPQWGASPPSPPGSGGGCGGRSPPSDSLEDTPENPRRTVIACLPEVHSPVPENVAPGASREERIALSKKICDMWEKIPEECSIGVFQRPDKTYFAIYVPTKKEPRLKKGAKKEKPAGKPVKKTRKTGQSQQQLMREMNSQLASAIAATAPGCAAPKDAVVEPPPLADPAPTPVGLGRGKGLMYANIDLLGMSRRVYGDTIPLVENPTPSGVISIPDGCACPCGCKNTESPAKSARLDLTSKRRTCNSCAAHQGRRKKACWENQAEDVKRRIMAEELV